jgi:Ca2+/H+ antiporter
MRRLRPADVAAGAAGVALLVVLFLPWYGATTLFGANDRAAQASAWQAFSVVDILLALAAVLAIALVVVTATARGPAKPVAFTVIATVASAIAVPLALWRALDPPQDFYASRYGAWLGLAATVLMFVASFAAMRDDRTPGAVPPDVPRRPAPPA